MSILVENLSKKFVIGSTSTSLTERITNIFKSSPAKRKDFWALTDINFEVESGEVLGIIGKNGAGKSTLLKILSQITYPTRGKVIIEGRVSSLLEVGTGFHPELTGKENIFLNGTILGMSRKEVKSKIDEIIDFAGVHKFINTPVKHYSSGMYVRLAFAVAAHLEPEVLIIDEVLAVGDAEFQKKCLGKMQEVAKKGRTVLFVSHNMNAVAGLCNRAIVISNGRLMFDSQNVQDAIAFYLNDGINTREDYLIENDSSWDNEVHTIESVSLVDGSDRVLAGQIHNTQKIQLKIRGKVNDYDSSLNIGFILYNSRQEKILSNWVKDGLAPDSGIPENGKFELMADFPLQFFNENHYVIEVVSVLHNIKHLIKPGYGPNLEFKIIGGRTGEMINPSINWLVSK